MFFKSCHTFLSHSISDLLFWNVFYSEGVIWKQTYPQIKCISGKAENTYTIILYIFVSEKKKKLKLAIF